MVLSIFIFFYRDSRKDAPRAIPEKKPSRYPHPSYRLSAWAWALFWILVFLPFLIMAYRIIWHFSVSSWDGLQNEIMVFSRMFTSWALKPVNALIFMPLFGFVSFKLHGRFSLPKTARPRIRPLYAT